MASGVILLILTALIHHGMCQVTNSLTPLSPCYSVFKVLPAGNVTAAGNNTMTTRYRYLSSFAAAGSSLHDPDNPDCIFTLEGPPNSLLQVQLSNVLIQSPGYVSTSQQDMGNCSLGAIRIYNFTTTGALVQVSEVCNSFLTGNTLVSDTNVIAVTTTIVRGNFDVTATIIPLNNTGNEDFSRNLPIRDGNVILLGHTQQETNLLSDFVNRSPDQPLNNTGINSSENDEYFDEYTYDDNGDVDSNKLHNKNQQHNNKLNTNSKKHPGQINNPPQVQNNGNSQPQNGQFNRPSLNTLQVQKDQLSELLSNALTTMKFPQQQEIPEMLPLVKLFLQERENANKLSSQNQPDTNTLINQLIQHLKTLASQNQLSTQMDTQHNLLSLIRNQVGNDKQTLASENLMLQNSLAKQASPITGIMDQNEKMDLLLHQLTQAGSDLIPQTLSNVQPLALTEGTEQVLSHVKQQNTQDTRNNDPSTTNRTKQMDNPNRSGIPNLMHLIRNQIKDTEDGKNTEQGDDSQVGNKNKPTAENNISSDKHDHQNTSKKYQSNESSHRENSKFIDNVTPTQEEATSNTPMPHVNNATSMNLPQTIPTPLLRHVPFTVDNNLELLHSDIDTNMIFQDSDYKW